MTLVELGVLLRGERVRCGYSVDEVASRLKITSRVVRSIEEGDLDGLPHAVYASGFIRAYATLVGVGEEEIRSALLELVPQDEPANQPIMVTPSASSRSLGWLVPLVAVLLLAGGGYAVYATGAVDALMELSGLWNKSAMQATPATPRPEPALPAKSVDIVQNGTGVKQGDRAASASAVESVPLAPSTSGSSVVPSGAASGASSGVPGGSVAVPPVAAVPGAAQSSAVAGISSTPPSGRSEAEPVRTSGFAPTPGASSGTAPGEAVTLQNSATPAKVERAGQGKNQIILTGLEECWVHSSADGTDIRQFSINKGDVFALSFSNKLVLKLGNAGGVQIKYNGESLAAPGTKGQVKTLTFPPAP